MLLGFVQHTYQENKSSGSFRPKTQPYAAHRLNFSADLITGLSFLWELIRKRIPGWSWQGYICKFACDPNLPGALLGIQLAPEPCASQCSLADSSTGGHRPSHKHKHFLNPALREAAAWQGSSAATCDSSHLLYLQQLPRSPLLSSPSLWDKAENVIKHLMMQVAPSAPSAAAGTT